MCIADRFIFACFLRSHVVFSATIIVIIIYFLFFDDYVSNLLTFLKRINVRNARWYYDHHFIFKFFFSFSPHHDQTVLSLSAFEGVLLTVRLCITGNLIVSVITSFSVVRKHVFFAIMNYESDLIDFSYNSQFFWCKQISSERSAAAARLIICI